MKKIYIIHHTDNDGYCSAAIVRHFKNNGCTEFKMYAYAYKPCREFFKFASEACELADQIFLVDISIDDFENRPVFKMLAKSGKLTWIDHHVTSLKSKETYPELSNIPGKISIERSAAWLCWEYFSPYKMPEVVELVDDHDRYIHALPQSINFMNGTFMRCSATDPNWDMWEKLLNNDSHEMEDILHDGTVITEYNKMTYARALKARSECFIFIYNDDNTEAYRGIALNYIGPSFVFDDIIRDVDDVNFAIMYHYDGTSDKWLYSIYSQNDFVHCNEIAEKFGGGGHKGAAGFSSKENVLIMNETTHILNMNIHN